MTLQQEALSKVQELEKKHRGLLRTHEFDPDGLDEFGPELREMLQHRLELKHRLEAELGRLLLIATAQDSDIDAIFENTELPGKAPHWL